MCTLKNWSLLFFFFFFRESLLVLSHWFSFMLCFPYNCLSKPTYAGRRHPQNQICTLCSYRKALNSSHCVLWDWNKLFSFSWDSCSLHFGVSALLQCGFVICLCLSMRTFPTLAGCCSQQAAAALQKSPACTFRFIAFILLQWSRKKNVSLKHQRRQCFWTHLNRLPEQTFCSYLGNYCVRQKE